MFQSRNRTEPYIVHTGVSEYHLDVYMMAAPQVAVNQEKQPTWERNQQPNIYAILTCTGEDKARGKKARITVKVVDKQNGKMEPVELDVLRLHDYQHEPTTKPPILQARSQDLSWQVRWRTTLKPKVTEPDLYRRAQMVFLSSTELDDFISKIAPLLPTRRLAPTPFPASASAKSPAPAPPAPPSSSSSTLSSSTSASSVRRMQTAFQPSSVQDDAPGSSSSSSSSGSGASASKSKGKSKRKELDVVDEATEEEEAPSPETERKREKEKEKENAKKKKKQKRAEVAPSPSGRDEDSPQRLPSTSPSTSTAAAGSRRNLHERCSSHSITSPEGSFSPTPSRPRNEDPHLISDKSSSSTPAPKPSSSSDRSPGRSSSSRPPPLPPPSYPQHFQHHHDHLNYQRSLSPAANPKSSPLRPQPVASTSSKPRSNPATSNLLLSDLAGLDFGNGPSTGDPSTSSTTPKKGGGQTNGATDFFSLIDLASPLVSPLKASNVLLVHPAARRKDVGLAPAVPAPLSASASAASEGEAGKKRAVEVGRGGGEVASPSAAAKKARLEDPEKDVWEMDLAGLEKEELKELMAEVMREEGFYKLVERVDEIARKGTGS